MSGDLLDINLLLALAWPNHQFHATSRQWFRSRGSRPWYTCAITELGFVRLSCNPAFSAEYKTPREASTLLCTMMDHPDHRFVSDSLTTVDQAFCRVVENLQGHKQVTDGYLVALAESHHLRFLTFDKKIKAFCPFVNLVEVLEM